MPKPNRPSLQRIIDQRSLPGLLLFDLRGKLISLNPIALQIMGQPRNQRFLKKIRLTLRNLKDICPKPKSSITSPVGPLIQTTISNGDSDFSLQAFYLDHQPSGRSPVAAILVTRVTSNRFNLDKARRQWSLSSREMDVMKALLGGQSDKEIASFLGIGTETVRGYLKNIRNKLGVSSRTAILSKLLLP